MLHGDENLRRIMLALARGKASFVETGAWGADSAVLLAQHVGRGYTNETDPKRHAECFARLSAPGFLNVFLSKTPSPQFLREINPEEPLLIRLDAHPVGVESSFDPWPLLGELELIRDRWPTAVVVVDDFCCTNERFPGHGSVPNGDPRPCPTCRRPFSAVVPLDLAYVRRVLPATWRKWEPDYAGRWIGYAVFSQATLPTIGGLREV